MPLKSVIRKGDTTTHGGSVIECIDNYPVFGIEVACKGHMVACPLCKGIFPIIDGISSMPIYGKHPAVEGMKTACGAVLIASQNAFQIEQVNVGSGVYSNTAGNLLSDELQNNKPQDYAAKFFVTDSETGEPMKNARYFAMVNDVEFEGNTDANGYATIHATGPDDVIRFHVSFLTPKRPLNKEGE